jgi:DNA invertase Pin-like site-specific DNA recombinase
VHAGSAAGLLVAKMDRLSRSVVDGAGLMERAAREGWALHFADLDLDTSTPAGEMAANTSSLVLNTSAALSVSALEMLWRPSEHEESDLAQRRPYRWRSPVGSSPSVPTDGRFRRLPMG